MKWEQITRGKIRLKLCDYVFTYGTANISGRIRVLTGLTDLLLRDEPSIANHIGGISEVGRIKINKKRAHYWYSILEALKRTIERNLLAYDDGKSGVAIFRDITLTDKQRLDIVGWVRDKFKGKIYNYPAIGMQLLDQIVSFIRMKRTYWFTRINLIKLPYCSKIWAMGAWAVAERGFGCPPKCADPDQMLDYILQHLTTDPDPNKRKYKLVFATDDMLKRIELQVGRKVS